jgi:signal transduction histidine kinase
LKEIAAVTQSESQRKATILLIDDDEIFVELMSDELKPHFVVEWARDGKTALDSVGRQTPDAIFMDHGLPDLSGVTLIDELRKSGCESPVIMLTASQDVRVAAAAMRAGAIDFVVKDSGDSFYDDIVPTATRAVEKWNNEKELEYLRELEEDRVRRTTKLNEELSRTNDQLHNAYQDIEASQAQLRAKNQRLSELYETAHRFVDNVSHEMRTPLTVIKEFVSIILDGLAGDVSAEQKEYLSITMAKTNDLARMVEDMLDISKIEAGLFRVERRRCRFGEVLESIRNAIEQQARRCNIELQIDEDPDLPDLFCDKEKAGRVLINLVVNATKFSDEGTTVTVHARLGERRDEVVIDVRDQGSGIGPENLQVIFERFQQVGQTKRSSTKGFGLGLNIVKELACLNMGDVSVQSTVGEGSTFSVTFPVFDYEQLIHRFIARRETFDRHGDHVVVLRACPVGPAPDIGAHIASFVAHYLTAFDLTFERPEENDVILLAVTADPEAMVERLLTNNREEMRLSPGSTVDISVEILHRWNVNEDPSNIADAFVALFGHEVAEQTDEP